MCIAELLKGDVSKQDFYASKMQNSAASVHDLTNTMYLYGNPDGLRNAISNKTNRKVIGNETFFMAMMYISNGYRTTGLRFGWKLNKFSNYILKRLLDSNKGIHLGDIYSGYSKLAAYNISDNSMIRLLDEFYEYVKDTEMFFLRKEYVQTFPKTALLNFIKIKSL